MREIILAIIVRLLTPLASFVEYVFSEYVLRVKEQFPLDHTSPLCHLISSYGFADSDVPDLAGKVALVTGANCGLGLAVAKKLAKHNAHVIITCRTEAKCQAAKNAILTYSRGRGTVETSVLELTLMLRVRQWTTAMKHRLKSNNSALDMLILSAGIMGCPYNVTQDGIESQFAVNHVAQAFIANEMVEAMRPYSKKSSTFQTTKPRIVFVNSFLHRISPHDTVPLSLAQINDPVRYNRAQWYGMSKLANLLFSKALSRRLQKDSRYSHILVNSMHPGGMYTNLPQRVVGNGIARIFQPILNLAYWAAKPVLWSADRAALTPLYLATSPEVERYNYRGEYFIPIAKVGKAASVANDGVLQDRVWEFTEQLWKQPLSQDK